MTEVGTRNVPQLNWDVLVTPSIPVVTSDLPPGMKQRQWSPISSTLIYGKRDAVLVDTFLTVQQSNDLVKWVAARGKNLTTIYITHGHGDHWFGTGALLSHFPNSRLVARPEVVRSMRQQSAPEFIRNWNQQFPDQIPDQLMIADELKGNKIELEGFDLLAVEVGHSDTDHTTCLNVPSIGLIVAGDVAYNDVHLYLAESNAQTRHEWISALDKIESLKPHAVIAGHKRPTNEDSPKIIEQTRQYIREFDKIAETTTTTLELYNNMMKIYPNHINPGALWRSAQAVKG
jgi:glyoxylase-like metal-dependent hydrolase (beta-lactamase superfamily II)